MISKTKLKILKLLSKKPSYGYKIGNELSITKSSIYKHLDYLCENNYIKVEKKYSKSERFKKVYKLTNKGKEFLEIVKLD
jgi:DNA-binding PadR family transcriptional regulator